MADHEPEAIQTDIYLDRLLNGADPHAAADEPDPELRATAELLQRSMLRFHPSFRFEERLAARLRAEALSDGPIQLGRLIPFRSPTSAPETAHAEGRGRGLIVGGAIASGVSIAGAFLVWRRARTTGVTATAVEQAL